MMPLRTAKWTPGKTSIIPKDDNPRRLRGCIRAAREPPNEATRAADALHPASPDPAMRVLNLGRRRHADVEQAMVAFTAARTADTEDELWLVEHDPVFTQGIAGREAHVLDAGGIPVERTQRGGQVTYHGPGQVVAYPLVDLKRLGIYVKEYVFRLEQAVLEVLADCGVTGHRVRGAPGIYVKLADPFGHARLVPAAPGEDPFAGLGKIAALGIKVSRHCTYHGLALNVAMDLEPFTRIDPCGYAGLRTVDLRSLGVDVAWPAVADALASQLTRRLGST
jgi:lipoyl(octanoyl) transferase